MTIDVATDGALMDKPFTEAYQLIESMVQNHYQWGTECPQVEKVEQKGGMFEVNSLDHVSAKVDSLTQKIDNLTITPTTTIAIVTPNCEICGVQRRVVTDCQLLAGTFPNQVNYAQENPYSDTYNPGWRNHLNFSYKNKKALFAPSPSHATPPGFQKGAHVAPTPKK
ncbi:uncharacterized protein LOC127102207 [Lathyrus oleraceus]|uniref:uncharacterized protein LOC127102207 n=1 Tax=Pisum sativum TaxID=3888 RepID=UPI0021D3B8CC|nr:uncharacterized protein LOC127102207 [Pisum sativum]